MKSRLALAKVTLTLCALLALNTANSAVYQWTDANGVVHYSDQLPKGEVAVEELDFVFNMMAAEGTPVDYGPIPEDWMSPAAIANQCQLAADMLQEFAKTPTQEHKLIAQKLRNTANRALQQRCVRESVDMQMRKAWACVLKQGTLRDALGC